jgi:hypothetical protein
MQASFLFTDAISMSRTQNTTEENERKKKTGS